jgi:RimJ/RimL family protein N-acetyltransferase
MAEADLAVSAAGSTCHEWCYLGVPLVVAELADNQKDNVAGLIAAGAAVSLGRLRPDTTAEAGAALGRLLGDAPTRRALALAGSRLVDGSGAHRVVARLLELSGPGPRLRPAGLADEAVLLAWRNDPDTILSCRQASSVTSDEHSRWLRASLDDPHRRIFMAEWEGRAVGTVRLDLDDEKTELSWTMDPAWRGRGLCKAMVRLAALSVAGTAWAEVKDDNPASARIAEHAGLTLDRIHEGVRHYTRPRQGG